MALKALLRSWWKVKIKGFQLLLEDMKKNCYKMAWI